MFNARVRFRVVPRCERYGVSNSCRPEAVTRGEKHRARPSPPQAQRAPGGLRVLRRWSLRTSPRTRWRRRTSRPQRGACYAVSRGGQRSPGHRRVHAGQAPAPDHPECGPKTGRAFTPPHTARRFASRGDRKGDVLLFAFRLVKWSPLTDGPAIHRTRYSTRSLCSGPFSSDG
jgi:hypothetical protein